MQLSQIDKEHRPDLFYSAKNILDEWIETEITDYEGGIILRKRCIGGWQDINLSAGAFYLHFIPEIMEEGGAVPDEDNKVLVADGFLNPQKYNTETSEWESMLFTLEQMTLEETDGDYDATALYYNGVDTVQIDIAWRIQNSKQRYRISSSVGTIVRLGAIVEDHQIEGVNVKQSIEDFLGMSLVETDTNEENGAAVTYYVFESDGFEITETDPVFEVDPYISIDEQTSYIDVTCDGYVLRFSEPDGSNGFITLRDADNTNDVADCKLEPLSDYDWQNSTDGVLTVLEVTPTRVVIQGTFTPHDGTNPLSECNGATIKCTIYADRIFCELTLDATATGFTMDSTNYGCMRFSGLTNPAGYIEDSGSETATSHGNRHYADGGDSANYGVTLADEINYMLIPLYSSNGYWDLYNRYEGYTIGFDSYSGDYTMTGENTLVWACIIDSAEREGGKQYDGSMNVAGNIEVDDDFSSDTSSDYTNIETDVLTWDTTNGLITPSTNYDGPIYLHNTALADQHWVKANVKYKGSTALALFVAMDLTSEQGYYGVFINNMIAIRSYNAGTTAFVNSLVIDFPIDNDTEYELMVKVVADYTFQFYIDGAYKGTIVDTGNTYSGGDYVGINLESNAVPEYGECHNFQAGTFSADLRLEIGADQKDTTLALTNGTAITSGAGCTSIGTSGKGSDGGWHYEGDSNDEVKYTVDIPRHKKVDVIPYWPFIDKDGVDYLLFHDKMDSVTSGHTPAAGSGTVTVNGSPSLDPNGNGISIGSGQSIEFQSSNNIDGEKGTLMFDYYPDDDGYYSTARRYLFAFELTSGDYFYCRLEGSADFIRMYYANSTTLESDFQADYLVAGQRIRFKFDWWSDGAGAIDYKIYANDNLIMHTAISTGYTQDSLDTNLIIGNVSSTGTESCRGSIDNIKIISDRLFKHGAFFTGNTAAQLSAGLHHKDIRFFADLTDTSADIYDSTDGGTITLNGTATQDSNGLTCDASGDNASVALSQGNNIDFDEGKISFWFNGSAQTGGRFFADDTGENIAGYDFMVRQSSAGGGIIQFYYLGNTIGVGDAGILDSNDHWIEILWSRSKSIDGTKSRQIKVDGEEYVSTTSDLPTRPTFTTDTFFIGGDGTEYCNGTMWDFSILSGVGTPQIPTVNGIPLQIPIIDRS